MAGMYKLTLIFGMADQGWTQTFYREADSARAATQIHEHGGLLPWLDILPRLATIDAVRAQEVDGLRRMYTRLLGYNGGPYTIPDLTAVAARIQIPFLFGRSRSLYLRGLPDVLVQRRRGIDVPGPALIRGIEKINRRIGELKLRGRNTIKTPKFRVKSWGPSSAGESFTQIEVDGHPDFRPGSYVDVGGTPLFGLRTETNYVCIESVPGFVTIVNDWPADLATRIVRKPVWIREKLYEYPLLDPGQFVNFTKYDTRARYRPASWYPCRPGDSVINPCGRIVDHLRVCYTVNMRTFFDDPGATIPVQWYFPDMEAFPDRGSIPYDHPFGSRNWDLEHDYETLLGERYQPRPWHSGSARAELSGLGLCGSMNQWNRGASAADAVKPINNRTGSPCCCGPGVLVLGGGPAAIGVGELLETPIPPVAGCPSCPGGAWETYNVIIADSGVPAWNGTWPIVNVGGGCGYTSSAIPGAGTITAEFVNPHPGATFRVFFVSSIFGVIATYVVEDIPNCAGPFVLEFQSGSAGFPATIEVEPVIV